MASLSQDQYRFLMANLAGLSLALPYRYVPKLIRNEFNFIPGVVMVYYCFGRQANTLVLFSAISYLICKYTPRQHVQRVSLCASLAFLSYAHLSRQIIDYGGYVLDISGPFMIAVQKITSLGFCLHDGQIIKAKRKDVSSERSGKSDTSDDDDNNNHDDCNNNNRPINGNGRSDRSRLIASPGSDRPAVTKSGSNVIGSDNEKLDVDSVEKTNSNCRGDLTEEQSRYAVIDTPKFNEFMGYFFHFPSVLCGPIMYFNDYSDFVNAPDGTKLPPGRHMAVARKLTISVTCAVLHLTLNPKFEVEFLRSPEFLIQTPLLVRFYYILIFTMLSRLKYYVAWHLGEAISNASGLGFNGYDRGGEPKWDLISNMNLLKFETCLSLRDAIHAWNKTTQGWLRRTAYERAPRKLSILSTYLLSAVWHGFYPGYYMTFLSGALFTVAARNGRKVIRPMFQRGTTMPKVYDAITFILTRLTIAYTAFPFVILDFHNNFQIYKSLYFSIHILALGAVLLGFVRRRK